MSYADMKVRDVVILIEDSGFDFNAVCRATGLSVEEIRLIAALHCNYDYSDVEV